MADVVDDADLIIAARAGDAEAYAALYDRHRVPAMRFARSPMTNMWNSGSSWNYNGTQC